MKKYAGVEKIVGKKDTTFYIRFKKNGKSTREKVGKKSDGMTEAKAKKLLEEKKILLSKGIDEPISTNNNVIVDVHTKMSLNKLSEIYFDKFDKLVEEEKHLEKEDKQHKDEEGVRREKSLYNTFWKSWSLALVPFHKLNALHFVKHIQDIQKLTKIVVRNQVEVEVSKYSSKYILNSLTLIKSIIKHTKCNHNPLNLSNDIKSAGEEKLESLYKQLRTKSQPRSEYLEPCDIKKILEKLKQKDKYFQGYLMSLIIASTGMRPDSCLNLKIKDFMFKDKIIKTYDFKRKMVYYCNLTPLVSQEIQALMRERSPSEFLFFSEKTKGLTKLQRTPDYLNETISEMFNANRFGNDRISLYTLRHSFATNLIKGRKDKNGEWITLPVSIFTIQKLLNHSKVETTIKHYAKFSPDFAIDAVVSYEESFI